MDAEKAGMDADRSDSRESLRQLEREFILLKKATRDASIGFPSGHYFRMSFPSVRYSPASVVLVYPRPSPEVSAAICVSSVSVVPSFRRSAVPPADLGFSKNTRTSSKKASAFYVFRKPL
jgi:hypothetical protein